MSHRYFYKIKDCSEENFVCRLCTRIQIFSFICMKWIIILINGSNERCTTGETSQLLIHKYRCTNTNKNTQLQIHNYKYTIKNTNTQIQIQIHKYKYTNKNTNTKIQIHKYTYTQIHKYMEF